MTGDATIEEQFGFEMDLDLEEDVQAELEDFILLARLGVEDGALHLARTVLWRHVHHFPVFAEVADFLLELRADVYLHELFSAMKEKDIQFPHEEQQAFTHLVHELYAKTPNPVVLLRQLVYEAHPAKRGWYKGERSPPSHQPLSPIQTHSIELTLRRVNRSHVRLSDLTPYALLFRVITTQIKHGLHWEAAQIFGLIIARPDYEACLAIHAKYKWLMLATREAKLLAEIQNGQADCKVGIEDALAIVSAKSTYAEHVMRCKACTQKGEGQVLRDSFTILLRWLFRRLPNTQPRGKLFDIQTRLGTFLLQNSVDQSQPTRYSSSQDTGRGTELACGDSGTLLTPKPDTVEDTTEIHGTKNSVDVEKSSPQLDPKDRTPGQYSSTMRGTIPPSSSQRTINYAVLDA
ncbi:hypothetical protein LTS08_008455 [Lithohypha guttulata]|nr:hypothetical protein LTS08_008455 [Lithohypha guttulata]